MIDSPQIRTQLKRRVKTWADRRKSAMLYEIARMGLRDTGELLSSINQKVSTRKGAPERITFSMARQGILQQLGVGRGTGIDQVGSTNRKSKPWITNALNDNSANELADIVADLIGDEALEKINVQTFKGNV